jgi:transposase InsO family protein
MEFYHHIHCKYTGIKGFVNLYNYALKYRDMVTEKAQRKLKILVFWEKHGLEATEEAFEVKKRTLFNWKRQLKEGGGKIEALNDQSRAPKQKRKRLWSLEIQQEIKRIRWEHKNLGKEKLTPILNKFCKKNGLECPGISTVGRLIKDMGGLRISPQKIDHYGREKKVVRTKKLRKPKDFKVMYPGHLVSLDTIVRYVESMKRYIITFEDIHTRFCFAWATTSHASLAAKEFFNYCQKVFPFEITFVLTDNGSEFAKHFAAELKRLHKLHYHTYPKCPKMNAHVERFNRTIQEDFVDYHVRELLVPEIFNRKLIDWLAWYNTERVHAAFQNKLSPVEFILSLDYSNLPKECNLRWTYTCF